MTDPGLLQRTEQAAARIDKWVSVRATATTVYLEEAEAELGLAALLRECKEALIARDKVAALFEGDPPDPNTYLESELFVAGALSTMAPFASHHPGYALPFARRALEALGEWEPTDSRAPQDEGGPS